MANTQQGFVTLEVDGLTETLRGLGKADRAIRNEVVKAMRDNAKAVAMEARKMPGVNRTSPRNRSFIKWAATQKFAAVKLVQTPRHGRALQEEFGAWTQQVGFETEDMYGKPQAALDAPQTVQPFRKTGYIIQPTIARLMPRFVQSLATDVTSIYARLVRNG